MLLDAPTVSPWKFAAVFIAFIFYNGLTWNAALSAEIAIDFQGEIIGWGSIYGEELDRNELGIRYLPSFRIAVPATQKIELDSEITANLYGISTSREGEEREINEDGKLYRSWVRLYTEHLEARLGIQEISFGPGRVLRSLRWFDQKDDRDPTGFTDGVKGALLRYYFENDFNFWVWSLYGNTEPMGISPFISWPNEAEFGARFQLPLTSGEIGLSFHHRNIDPNDLIGSGLLNIPKIPENRTGFDITYDLGIGIWFEATHLLYQQNLFLPESIFFATMGGDYTFDIGNGLYTLIEFMGIGLEDVDGIIESDPFLIIAFSQQYPLNLIDGFRFFALHQTESETTNLQVDWQRTYDNLIINLILFYTHIPENASANSISAFAPADSTNDRGVKLVIQYNH